MKKLRRAPAHLQPAAGDLQQDEAMPARAAGLFEPHRRRARAVAGEQRDRQRSLGMAGMAQAGIRVRPRRSVAAGLGDVDDDFAQRLPAEQHAVGHAFAIGQRNLDRPAPPGDLELGGDDEA